MILFGKFSCMPFICEMQLQLWNFGQRVSVLLLYSCREAVVSLVLKYCGKELEEYGTCVASNPENWQNKCKELGEKASACSSGQ